MVNVSSLFGQIVSEIFTAVNFDNLVASTGAGAIVKSGVSWIPGFYNEGNATPSAL